MTAGEPGQVPAPFTGDDPATWQPRVYRVVDAHHQGWHPVAGRGYSADYGFDRDLADRDLETLAATCGPLRPVLPITAADRARLRALFGQAGRKSVATVCSALETVFHQLREAAGGPTSEAYHAAWRQLRAGREGSWESETLMGLVLFGNDLNLTARRPRTSTGRGRSHGNITDARAAGPSSRVHVPARDEIATMIHRWVTAPDRYTEVAETLADVMSSYCDDTAGRDGWRAVADQWLQPGGLAQETFSACYRLLYSLSAHFNPDLI